jgi:hypothetical protein
MRGSRDLSAELGTGEGESKGTQEREIRRGGRAGIYGRQEKRRGSAARAFPDWAAAKLGGANRTTEITNIFLATLTVNSVNP